MNRQLDGRKQRAHLPKESVVGDSFMTFGVASILLVRACGPEISGEHRTAG